MRLSRYNRLMAIQRHPEYIEEAKEYWRLLDQADTANDWGEGSFREQAAREGFSIERKWGAHPQEVKNAEQLKGGRRKTVQEVLSITGASKKPMQVINLRAGGDGEEKSISTTVAGERLYLAVDVSDTEGNLMLQFQEIIKRYKALLLEDKSREKGSSLDHWAIYDMMQSPGMTTGKLARQLWSKYEYGFSASEKQVGRAYKEACKMMKQLDDEIKSTPT